ncbi:cytochrome P450 2C31-like isoform X2 [Mercenaria mercenaria]|nr:cytochrome P450 2C31-like isoform X2 [Mercenaria mercenaria]
MRKAFDTVEFEECLNDKAKGFFGTYLVYGHADILLGPYTERTFRLKEVMHKGLQPSMSTKQLQSELQQLVDGFKNQIGKDFCPRKSIESSIAGIMTMLIAGERKDNDEKIISDFVFWSNKLLSPRVESLLKNLPFLRHFPGEPGSLYALAKKKRDILLQRFLTDYRETYKAGINRGLVDTCLNIQELETQKDGSCWLTDDMIRALILDTIGGGFVSTSNTILATILNLLNNRRCLDKMVEEINAVLSNGKFCTWADVKIMPYCYAVILETQRYSTLVPIVSHYCSTKDVEFEGYTIPRDTMVWGNIWSGHHDEAAWTNAWTFNPERFLDSTGNLLPEEDPLRKRLIPLGVGKRYCVGSDFAMSRLFTYIVTLVQHFDILSPKDTELVSGNPNNYTGGAVLQVEDFMLRVERRN